MSDTMAMGGEQLAAKIEFYEACRSECRKTGNSSLKLTGAFAVATMLVSDLRQTYSKENPAVQFNDVMHALYYADAGMLGVSLILYAAAARFKARVQNLRVQSTPSP